MLFTDLFLQKAKKRYNSPRSLSTKVDLGDMSTEIKLRPPYKITAADLDISEDASNGLDMFKPFKDSHRPTGTRGPQTLYLYVIFNCIYMYIESLKFTGIL